MATLHEMVGMRIGLTLTDSTIPSKAQVESFLQEGLNRVQTLLDPEDLWSMTKTYTDDTYSAVNGISLSDIASSDADVTGYAQIISILAEYNDPESLTPSGVFVRATEVPAKDWHKATMINSMYYGTEAHPVFSYKSGKLLILPAPNSAEINYIGTLKLNADDATIPNVPSYVESVVINYATAQAASMLAAHYAQEEDPISQQIMAIAQVNQQQYTDGLSTLLRKSKVRGNIS